MEKLHDIILLPSNKQITIPKTEDINNNLLYLYGNEIVKFSDDNINNATIQHLAVLSNGKLKENDWCTDGIGICQIEWINNTHYKIKEVEEIKPITWIKGLQKIIATTDKSLLKTILIKDWQEAIEYQTDVELPLIPLDYIKYYISEYCKGNTIKQLKVEYELVYKKEVDITDGCDIQAHSEIIENFKVNSKNEICIKLMDDKFEKLGLLIDEIDNLANSLKLSLPDKTHIEQINIALPEKVKKLKEVYIEITNDNPWDYV